MKTIEIPEDKNERIRLAWQYCLKDPEKGRFLLRYKGRLLESESLTGHSMKEFFGACLKGYLLEKKERKSKVMSNTWWSFARMLKMPVFALRSSGQEFSVVADFDTAYPRILSETSLAQIRREVKEYWDNLKIKKEISLGSICSSLIYLYYLTYAQAEHMVRYMQTMWRQDGYLLARGGDVEEIREKEQEKQQQGSNHFMVKLYKDGDTMAILTDANDEREFSESFADALSLLIESGKYVGDWSFQLERWLPQYVEICCKYRGYKSNVKEKRLLTAGEFPYAEQFKVSEAGHVNGVSDSVPGTQA